MNIWIWAILVFIVDFVADFAWAMYVKSLQTNKYVVASLWSGFISLVGAFTIISYVQNWWLIIPSVLGGMLGTFLTKYIKLKQDEPDC